MTSCVKTTYFKNEEDLEIGDYFYFPHNLMYGKKYRTLSADGKVLYALLFDRMHTCGSREVSITKNQACKFLHITPPQYDTLIRKMTKLELLEPLPSGKIKVLDC